jgi:single-strand DNA-binding protein
MNRLTNRVSLIGNLGADPKITEFKTGKKAELRVATNESYKDASGQKVEDTQWHTCVAWGKTADIASDYLKKGNKVAIEGRLQHRNFEDSDGVKRYVSEVKISEILMLNGKGNDN